MNGKIFEDIAANYLIQNDFKIIQRNIRLNKSEVDIIASKDNEIFAIEVKYRTNIEFLKITQSQLNRIEYLMNSHFGENNWSFMILFVDKYHQVHQINL